MIIYRETKQKIINIVGISILVISVIISSVFVFTSVNKVKENKKAIAELHKTYDAYKADLEALEDESFGIISGEIISAKSLGQNLASDMEDLADNYDLLYKADLTTKERTYMNQIFSNVSVKLDGVLRTANAIDSLKTLAWINNDKVDIRFESILNYDAKDVPCLFTMWDDDKFYGYVTSTYDIQTGMMKDIEVTLSKYGQKHEKNYDEVVVEAEPEKESKEDKE